ncbi:hypothetical protein GYB59_02105 [bacterium]|nr:hypothetical protein [bacterium]
MGTRVKVNDKAFMKALSGATGDGLKMATVFAHQQAQLMVNKPNTGVRVPVKRKTKGGNKRSRTVYANPSAPGEPPRKQTGWGQRNIVWEFDDQKLIGRYGVRKNALYMYFLHIGTRFIAPRPWLLEALTNNLQMVTAILQASGRKRR